VAADGGSVNGSNDAAAWCSQFLGNGAHAMVFVAVDIETNKRYAAKVFEPESKGGLVDGDHDKLCMLSASQVLAHAAPSSRLQALTARCPVSG
jgi:hypothetical protein